LFVVQFLDGSGSVLASNVFDLVAAGLPSEGPGVMQEFTMPEVSAPTNAATVRAGASMIDAYSTSGSQSFFVDAFSLEAVGPVGSPVISTQPVHTTVSPGGTASFSVVVSNPEGITYQWQFNSTNLINGGNVSGVNQPTLTITNASASDVGLYRVEVSNSSGSTVSSDARLALVDIEFFPVIVLTGKVGDSYRVDYATALAPTTWIPLSTNLLSTSPQLIVDTNSPGSNSRFYRAVLAQ
jgi:hypothetical protein